MTKPISFPVVRRVYVCDCCTEKTVKWFRELWLFGKPFIILFKLTRPAWDKVA